MRYREHFHPFSKSGATIGDYNIDITPYMDVINAATSVSEVNEKLIVAYNDYY